MCINNVSRVSLSGYSSCFVTEGEKKSQAR